MSTGTFYVLMSISMIFQLATTAFSCRNLGLVTASIGLASMAVAALYAYFRAKSGNYKIRLSVWSD